MKRILGVALLLSLFSLPLLAGKNSQEFFLPSDVRIGDAQLPAGHCNVVWTEPSGSQVQLTIRTEGKKPITLPARMVERNQGSVAVQTFVAKGVRYVQEFDTKTARFIVQDPSEVAK
jgi:D-serine deaminase-like pyridoxal phosphate-dependent protein